MNPVEEVFVPPKTTYEDETIDGVVKSFEGGFDQMEDLQCVSARQSCESRERTRRTLSTMGSNTSFLSLSPGIHSSPFVSPISGSSGEEGSR